MSEYTTLIRPDGSTLQVPKTDAAQLQAMGYKEETFEEGAARIQQEEKAKYYSGGTQGLGAFVEGALSGASFGISDQIEKGLGWDVSERAQYNPGKRFAGEITGAIAGSLVTGTPANLLSRGAASVTGGIASKALRGAAVGAIEGAAYGAGAEISHSALTGDPLTVESTLAGAGWGAVWGGGIGGIAGGISGKIEARAAAKREAVEAALQKARSPIEAETYAALRGSIDDASAQIGKTMKETQMALEGVEGLKKAEMASAVEATNQARLIREGYFNEMEAAGMDKFGSMLQHKKAGIAAFKEMQEAIKTKDWEALTRAQEKFGASLTGISEQIPQFRAAKGIKGNPEHTQPPPFNPFVPNQELVAKTAEKSFQELSQLGAAAKTLKSLPTDATGFAGMTQDKADRMFAAVDSVLGSSAAELDGLRKGLEASIVKTAENMGVKIEGTASTQLRKVWETAREAASSSAGKAAEKMAEGQTNWAKAGGIALGAAALPIKGVMMMKSAVLGAVTSATEKWAPGAIKGIERGAGKFEPLKTRLDGTIDKESKDRREMMAQRAKEIREAAPAIKDTMYKAIAPLDVHHPEFAKGVYDTAVNQFAFLLNKLPKDPGNAYSRLQTLWKPDPVAMEKFARYYEVFQNPVGVINDALKSLKITPEAAEGLQNMNPALWTHLRVSMLERLSDPKVMNKISYEEQVRLGTLLGLQLHSTMTPQFIATQQTMFAERQKPLNMPAQPGMSESGGRPSPTQSQTNQGH